MDKIRVEGVLNDRAFFLRSMDELFNDLVNTIEEIAGRQDIPQDWKMNATYDFGITDKEKLENALLQLYIKGRELLDTEQYEKLQQLTNDYNKLKEIYEKRYGPYIRRQGGNAGTANGEDGPSGLF